MARVLYNSPNRISQGFSSDHKAVDLRKSSVESENVVYAHSSGTVVDVVDGYDTMRGTEGMLSYGNYVFIDHGNGYKTRYAHLLKNTITVKVGQHVDENTKIGVMGESGNAFGRHLHFEVHQNGVRINPVPYLTNAFGGSTPQPQGAKYQVYDNVKKYWLPNVTIGSSEYAGNFGNAIVERMSKKGVTSELSDGIYKIRLKGNDLYLRFIFDSIQIKNDCSCSGCWQVEKVDDNYYKISHSLIKNKYFTIQNNKIELSTFANDKSLFMIVRNDNGSYSIYSKSDNKYIKYNDTTLELSDFIVDDPTLQFFFETIDESMFIETNKTYTSDGKFINDLINTNFSKISYDFDTEIGLTKSTVNARNQCSVYEYDDKERLTAIKFGQRKVNYIYNSQNLLSKIIYGKKEYNFIYDEFTNNKSLKIGDNITLITDQYEDNNGNLSKIIYGNGHSKSYIYDEFGRIKTITEMNDKHNFKYGNNGNLLKVLTNNNEIKFAYDLGDRLTEYKNNNFKFHNEYDISNNVIHKKYLLDNLEEELENTFNDDNALIKMTFDDKKVNYTYDKLGRLINSNINDVVVANYEYQTQGNRTSTLINKIILNDNCYYYKFDKLNNMTHVYHNGVLENKYYYNEYNELIKEDNYLINKTFKYGYDCCGNLMYKNEYEINTNNYIKGNKYRYDNNYWDDQLTSFNGESILYDEIGNPIYIGNEISLDWINGNQLSSYTDNEKSINYKYDYTNTRISKIVNGVETHYYNDASKIVLEKTGNNVLYYIYNDINDLIGFKYNGTLYYYLKNYQNDIIAILNDAGIVIANYIYDSFGNTVSIKDNNGNEITDNSNIAIINPFRYRSYYFDKETNLYYLKNRYYNPKWGRFLNADGILLQSTSLSGYNLYVYANNNFINNVDNTGYASISSILSSLASSVNKLASQVVSQAAKNVAKTTSKSSNYKKVSAAVSAPALAPFLPSMSEDLIALSKITFAKAAIILLLIGISVEVYNQVKAGNITIDKDSKPKPCTKAWRSNGGVVRDTERFTIEEAANEYKFGSDIMCDNHSSAWKVANNFPPPILDEPHRNLPGYYWHYHGTGTIPHTHVWFYGTPPQWAQNQFLRH